MIPFWKALLVLLLASQVHCQLRASHNETCGEGIRCDSKKSLSCKEQICRCLKPEEMVFETRRDMCVVLAGERCSYTAVEILKEDKRWTEKLDCVQNAVCNNDGYCGCSSSYFESSDGFCKVKLVHGMSCVRDNQCKTGVCHNGTCSCNLSEARYDNSKGKCVGIDGTLCNKYDYDCVPNAICNYKQETYYRNGAERCRCSSSYIKSKDGFCLAKYGMACNSKLSPCIDAFSCIGGICSCPFPSHQRSSGGNSPCQSFVRGPCPEKVNDKYRDFECVENAICKTSPFGISECQCQDGYIESNGRACKLAHGQPCEVANSECDMTSNLVCKDGKCSCNDFEIYDEDNRKCRGLIGAICELTGGVDQTKMYCVEGAVCEDYRDPGIGKGTCSCMRMFQPNSERKCESAVVLESNSGNANNDTVAVLPMTLNEPVVGENVVKDASSIEETSS